MAKKESNIILNENEINERKVVLSSKVRNLVVSLTNRCNLKCVMCPTKNIPWYLPDKVKKEIIELMPYLESIAWTGGEIFLYEGYEELLDEAWKHKVQQKICTNGILLDGKKAEKIVNYGIETAFSVDGTTKDVYEKIRNGSDFAEIEDRITAFNTAREKINPNVITALNVVIMKYNWHQIKDFVEFAIKHKFSKLCFFGIDCANLYKFENDNLYYHDDNDALKFIDNIFTETEKRCKENNIELSSWPPPGSFYNYIREKKNFRYEKNNNKLVCIAPWRDLFIETNGDIRPTCLCPFYNRAGNVRDGSIEELWNGPGMKSYRERLLYGNLNNFCSEYCLFKINSMKQPITV